MARKPPYTTTSTCPSETTGALHEPVHPDGLSHFTEHVHARADRPDALLATAQATPMPREDIPARKDADQLRRTTPRLAISARPRTRHDLASPLDMPSGRRLAYHRRARRSRSSAMTTSTHSTLLCLTTALRVGTIMTSAMTPGTAPLHRPCPSLAR